MLDNLPGRLNPLNAFGLVFKGIVDSLSILTLRTCSNSFSPYVFLWLGVLLFPGSAWSQEEIRIEDRWHIEEFNKKNGLFSNVVWDFCEDNNNRIWIATQDGVQLIDALGGERFGPEDGLTGFDFKAITYDRSQDVLFVGGVNGLFKSKPLSTIYQVKRRNKSAFERIGDLKIITKILLQGDSVYVISDDDLLLIQNDSLPPEMIDSSVKDFLIYNRKVIVQKKDCINLLEDSKPYNCTDCEIISIIEKNDSLFWLEKNNITQKFFLKSYPIGKSSSSIISSQNIKLEDGKNTPKELIRDPYSKAAEGLLILTDAGMFEISGKLVTGFEGKEVTKVFFSSNDAAWIGTYGRGMMFVPSFEPNAIQLYRSYGKNKDVNFIRAIEEFKDELYFGTKGGLFKFDRYSDQFIRIGNEEEEVFSLVAIKDYLFVGRKKGGKEERHELVCYNSSLTEVESYDFGYPIRVLKLDSANKKLWIGLSTVGSDDTSLDDSALVSLDIKSIGNGGGKTSLTTILKADSFPEGFYSAELYPDGLFLGTPNGQIIKAGDKEEEIACIPNNVIITTIKYIDDTLIYIGTFKSGLYKITKNNGKWSHQELPGIEYETVYGIIPHRDTLLWLVTGNRIKVYNNKSIKLVIDLGLEDKLQGEDFNGNAWLIDEKSSNLNFSIIAGGVNGWNKVFPKQFWKKKEEIRKNMKFLLKDVVGEGKEVKNFWNSWKSLEPTGKMNRGTELGLRFVPVNIPVSPFSLYSTPDFRGTLNQSVFTTIDPKKEKTTESLHFGELFYPPTDIVGEYEFKINLPGKDNAQVYTYKLEVKRPLEETFNAILFVLTGLLIGVAVFVLLWFFLNRDKKQRIEKRLEIFRNAFGTSIESINKLQRDHHEYSAKVILDVANSFGFGRTLTGIGIIDSRAGVLRFPYYFEERKDGKEKNYRLTEENIGKSYMVQVILKDEITEIVVKDAFDPKEFKKHEIEVLKDENGNPKKDTETGKELPATKSHEDFAIRAKSIYVRCLNKEGVDGNMEPYGVVTFQDVEENHFTGERLRQAQEIAEVIEETFREVDITTSSLSNLVYNLNDIARAHINALNNDNGAFHLAALNNHQIDLNMHFRMMFGFWNQDQGDRLMEYFGINNQPPKDLEDNVLNLMCKGVFGQNNTPLMWILFLFIGAFYSKAQSEEIEEDEILEKINNDWIQPLNNDANREYFSRNLTLFKNLPEENDDIEEQLKVSKFLWNLFSNVFPNIGLRDVNGWRVGVTWEIKISPPSKLILEFKIGENNVNNLRASFEAHRRDQTKGGLTTSSLFSVFKCFETRSFQPSFEGDWVILQFTSHSPI